MTSNNPVHTREMLLETCYAGLRWLCDNPDVEEFLASFWYPECRKMSEGQRRNLLFVLYEAAWKRAERTAQQAEKAKDPLEALNFFIQSRRYFEAFKNLGEYL